MNLPCLEEFGCFSSALQSLRNLESLVINLSGCGQMSLEARMELHQSIKSLKWFRGSLDTWVNIEGLPKREWFPRFAHIDFGGVIKARCTRGFRFIWQRMRQLSARQLPHVGSVYFEPTRFGRSSATSSDESAGEDAETEPHSTQQEMLNANKPFPCSHPSCHSFHSSESGYCEKHRWSGLFKRICVVGNAWRQNVELSVLILAQAVVEVESRFLLVLLVLSLLPVASYSFSESTGVSGTLIFLIGISTAIVSIFYTTARLNQMQALSKKLEVEAEALYAKHLQNDMSRLFGDWGRDDIAQPHFRSLTEHFVEARKHLDDFDKNLCLPLREFLEEHPGSISRQDLRPVLMTLPMAQEAVVREGEPSRILDLLYCDVLFGDWEKMLSAWCFLKTRAEYDELREIEIVRTRDSFASAQAGVRCAEMVVKINHYLATIRFREASLTKLENQVDDVHHLAEQVGLVTGSLQVDPLLMSGRPAQQSRLVVVVVALLRISSLLAAVYFGGQYFVRYSPPFIRSNLPQLIWDPFALKQTVEPSDGRLPEAVAADSGWLEESLLPLLPSIVFSLPYLALIIVLLSDLRRCRSANIKLRPLKPTQLLYEEYFGIEGKLYGFKVAMLQLFTVMLQAFGKLQILGGLVSFAFHSAPKHSDAFEGCFWAFVGFLCLNSIYPTILLGLPTVKWVRRGAAMMDAVLDIAYTSTYLIITLLAIYELQLGQAISGNFGDEASVNFQAELDPAFAFPSDFFGFFAVYYSLAHVCTVCRALERSDRLTYWKKLQSLPSSASQSLLIPSRFSCSKRYRICSKALHFCCIGFVLCCLCNFQSIVFSQPVDTSCHVSISKPLNIFVQRRRLVVLSFTVLAAPFCASSSMLIQSDTPLLKLLFPSINSQGGSRALERFFSTFQSRIPRCIPSISGVPAKALAK